jgi:hypothetical protein
MSPELAFAVNPKEGKAKEESRTKEEAAQSKA